MGEQEREYFSHKGLKGPQRRGVQEGVHCHSTLNCLHLHPWDGDLRAQGLAWQDAVTLVLAGGEMISARLDGKRPSVHEKELDSTICLGERF